MKTAISIPDELFASADALAERLGVSRSQLYATAVAEFLAKHAGAEVTARLNEVYATEASRLDPALRRAQARALGRTARAAEW
jgi:metal-responsive CopG/Arc/MetJ family transcriptional regulator